MLRKLTRFTDMMAAAFREDPENVVTFQATVYRDGMSS